MRSHRLQRCVKLYSEQRKRESRMQESVRILCAVRDWRQMQRMIGDLDDGEHCIVDIAATGRQALNVCMKALPDILVIDAVLAEMDGLGVVDRLHMLPGTHMPRVIGGARTAFAREGFERRGAQTVLALPWNTQALRSVLFLEIERARTAVDWQELLSAKRQAGELLTQMGMHASLKGYAYLCSAAALACAGEARLYAIGRDIYVPIAAHHNTTAQNVERLIRHAIESTMNAARAKGVYSLFGNTIDPAKGKPTNAQAIAMLVQRMRVERSRIQ